MRNRSERPCASCSRSSSRSSISERDASPSSTQTWQVVQAHTPPQFEGRSTPAASAASRIDVPRDTSALLPAGWNVTRGIGGPASRLLVLEVVFLRPGRARVRRERRLELLDAVAGHRLRDVLVHAPLGELLRRGVDRLDPGLHGEVVAALHRLAEPAHPVLDLPALLRREELAVEPERRLERREDPVALDA